MVAPVDPGRRGSGGAAVALGHGGATVVVLRWRHGCGMMGWLDSGGIVAVRRRSGSVGLSRRRRLQRELGPAHLTLATSIIHHGAAAERRAPRASDGS